MNFLNPLFLFGLSAAALPILIHLFTKRRPKDVPFSSLEFLSEVQQSEIRRLRIKQWLLLLLRTLAVAAIATAMARPALPGGVGRAGEAAATTLVALVDVSGSMSAIAADNRPLLASAKRAAEDLLATLGPADQLLLVPYDRTPRPVSDAPIGDAARLRTALQALTPSAQTTDHAAALALAARTLAEARTLNKELVWFSDFQRSGVADGAALESEGPWSEARIYLVPMTPRSRANAGVTDARLLPSGDATALSVSAHGDGVPAGDFALEVRDLPAAGETAATLGRGFVSLPGTGEGATLLPLSAMPDAGGEVLLPADVLPLDDRRVFAAGRAGALRVLLREDGEPSALRFALEAGSPASGLEAIVAGAGNLAERLRDADVLVLGDLARLGPAETQAVLDYHRGGGGLLLAPGARADLAWWNDALLGELGLGRLGPIESAPAQGSWRLTRRIAGHAVLEGFPARPGEALSTARILRARRVETSARVLLAHDHERPALIEGRRSLLLATPLDGASGDLAVSGAFLPLVHQATRVLGRGTAAASLMPGEHWRAPASTGDWRIVSEDGREVAVSLQAERGATRAVSEPFERPGLYRILESGRLRGSVAVNPDPRESALASFEERELLAAFPAGRARVLRPGADFAQRVREARFGRELWPLFVMLALALLIAETILGRWGMGGASAPRGAKRQA